MKNKKPENLKPSLARWMLKEPLKFTMLFLSLMILSTLIVIALGSITKFGLDYLSYAFFITSGILSVYMLIKWLPKDIMDRKSYVTIVNARIIFCSLFSLISIPLLILVMYSNINFLLNSLLFSSLFFLSLSSIFFVFVVYIMGLIISGIYATYKRGLAMGVPRLKMLLSIPFTVFLYGLPGYLLPGDKKETMAITVKPVLFNNLTNWITKRTRNAIIAFSVGALLTICMLQLSLFLAVVIFGAIFATWVLITGMNNFKKNIGGAYATYSVSINILFIIAVLLFPLYAHKFITNNITNDSVFYDIQEELNAESFNQNAEVIDIEVSQIAE